MMHPVFLLGSTSFFVCLPLLSLQNINLTWCVPWTATEVFDPRQGPNDQPVAFFSNIYVLLSDIFNHKLLIVAYANL
jgi:hypothetical protein